MPLFSGVPFFNVTPQSSDGRTQAAVSRGLSRGFQNRQFNEDLVEQKRQFDAGANLRTAQANLNEARLKDLNQQSREGVIISEWMDVGAVDPSVFERKPAGVKSFAGLNKVAEVQAKMSQSKMGAKNKAFQAEVMNQVSELPRKLFSAAMQELKENQMSPKFWGIIESAPQNLVSSAGKELEDRRSLVESGASPEEIARFDAAAAGSGQTIRAFDDEGNVTTEITTGRGSNTAIEDPSQITKSVRSKVQSARFSREQSLSEMDGLLSELNDSAVGFEGVFREFGLNRFLTQLGVPIDEETASTRTKMRAVLEGILRKVSDDTRFNKDDVQRIKQILPSTGVFESGENARISLTEVMKIFAKRNIRDRQAEGIPITPETIESMWDMRAAVDMGLISREAAIEEARKRSRKNRELNAPAPPSAIE